MDGSKIEATWLCHQFEAYYANPKNREIEINSVFVWVLNGATGHSPDAATVAEERTLAKAQHLGK